MVAAGLLEDVAWSFRQLVYSVVRSDADVKGGVAELIICGEVAC